MLATSVPDPVLLPGWAGEPKWDGWRALVSVEAEHIMMRSRRDTDLVASFPEIETGSRQLPDATALDGVM